MLRRLSIRLLISAIAVAPLPTEAQEGTAKNLGAVTNTSVREVVKPSFGFQGALQGAGTPNQAGIGGYLPLSTGENSVWFLDALVNAHFGDREGYSSIINTNVAGGFSTSTRLGYRCLNGDRSWMYGLNAGYDSRSLQSGDTDTGFSVTNKKTVGFQQIALNAEAVSNGWIINGYGLIPVGDVEQRLNSIYQSGALNTYGMDAGYYITPQLLAYVGYYYQHGDLNTADGSGVLGRLAYSINNGITVSGNISYDNAFETRISADMNWRFNTNRGHSKETPKANKAVTALTSSPRNRELRAHDSAQPFGA